jgi:hypothetical protein
MMYSPCVLYLCGSSNINVKLIVSTAIVVLSGPLKSSVRKALINNVQHIACITMLPIKYLHSCYMIHRMSSQVVQFCDSTHAPPSLQSHYTPCTETSYALLELKYIAVNCNQSLVRTEGCRCMSLQRRAVSFHLLLCCMSADARSSPQCRCHKQHRSCCSAVQQGTSQAACLIYSCDVSLSVLYNAQLKSKRVLDSGSACVTPCFGRPAATC